ncbi:MAG TPA: cytochrome c [Gallionella sp.]|nr:cytochrome c [Gallionella sp.]
MLDSKRLTLALWMFLSLPGYTLAGTVSAESRGELLYTTHCIACHAADIHWREQKLATDWISLVAQVNRWQASTGLIWSNDEIEDVARYLNKLHYGFPAPPHKDYSQNKKSDRMRH